MVSVFTSGYVNMETILHFFIVEFINGIPFSSLWRDIKHFFNQNLNHEVNLISMSLKLFSTYLGALYCSMLDLFTVLLVHMITMCLFPL